MHKGQNKITSEERDIGEIGFFWSINVHFRELKRNNGIKNKLHFLYISK